MKSCGGAQFARAGNKAMTNAVEDDAARQEAGLNGIAREGLRKRCWQHCSEAVSCMLTWNGLK